MSRQYVSILQWVIEEGIISEKGEGFDFHSHPFLIDILCDWSPEIVVTACAQVGKSVTFSIKTLFAVKHLKLNAIYTMPTDSDVNEFVSSKFNKIIQMNQHVFKGIASDNIDRKEFDDRFIFFKGTVSKTAPISTSADLLIHDEISRSDQNAIVTYKSRLKASKYRWRWLFSNPGTERDELDLQWVKSDRKEWFVTCPSCKESHYLDFPESIDIERKIFICKSCKNPLSDDDRRKGKWCDKDGREWNGELDSRYKSSGYHISHLMCPWISAAEILEDAEGDPAYFNNFVLGKSYSPGDLSLSKTALLDLWTPKQLTTNKVYLGVDVGNIKHYILRSEKGIFKIGKFTQWDDLDTIISFYKPTSGVIDALPDSTASKYFVDKYNFMNMSYFQENANNPQVLVWWGEKEKKGIVYSHRDRILDKMFTEMLEAKWLIGVPADKEFQAFIKHFETLRRQKVVNNKGIERFVWESTTGEDHYVFACLYAYLAMLSDGSGVFFNDIIQNESVLGADNVYDITRAFVENNI